MRKTAIGRIVPVLLVIATVFVMLPAIALCSFAWQDDGQLEADLSVKAGDANGDGDVGNADALAIFKYIYNPQLYPLACPTAADTDFDGEITNADALAIFKYIYNPTLYPIEAPVTPEPVKLNIGSYNIAHGSAVNLKMEKLGEDIKDKKLDIVGVQEVDQFSSRSMNIDTMKELSESSGLEYYAFFKAIDLRGGEYGVGILSKYPILETEKTELYSGTEEQRVLGHAVIDVGGERLNFFVTHLSYESKALRDRQFATIAEKTAGLDNFVVTGDFNTSNFNEYAPIKNMDMVNNSESSINTFPSPTPSSSIDNIVFSKNNWSFGDPSVLPNGNSDHCMLYATGTFYTD